MATRPDCKLENVAIIYKTVRSGVQVVEGVGVKKGAGGEGEVDVCAAGDNAYGIAMESVLGDGKKQVQIALLNSAGVVPVKASGTATAGEYAECGTDGFQNRTLGGGTTVRYIAGKFTQDGVDNDYVGLQPGQFAGVSS